MLQFSFGLEKVLAVYEKENDKDTCVINKILPRYNVIIRKSVNLSKASHIIASNIDQAILVATIAMIAPMITAITKPAIGPKRPIFKIVAKLRPANAEITPTERDM